MYVCIRTSDVCPHHIMSQGLDPSWNEESASDVCTHTSIYIHRKQWYTNVFLTMSMSTAFILLCL